MSTPQKKAPFAEGLRTALESALTQKEITQLATAALVSLDDAGKRKLIESLAPESADAIRPFLSNDPGKKPKALASKPKAGNAKIRELWEGLWSEWNDCIFEAEDEDGKYVHQDAHWEPPFFDSSEVASDLEEIAKRMYEFIDRVWVDDLAPDLSFIEELREAAASIGSGLPEWFDPPEGIYFGTQVTRCLLEWEWRRARQEELNVFGFAERIRDLEKSVRDGSLDDNAIVTFFTALPEEDQREVFIGLDGHRTSKMWATVLEDARSGWFLLYQRLARKWNRARFAETSRTHIAQDWTLALPLIAEQIRKKAYPEALSLIDDALKSLLPLQPGKQWNPTREFLIHRRPLDSLPEWQTKSFRLLGYWQKVAIAKGDREIASALGVQCAIGSKWEDWDKAIEAFDKATPSCDMLFKAWQSMVAQASLRTGSRDGDLPFEWIVALAEAAKNRRNGPWFMSAVSSWLTRVEATPRDVVICEHSLAALLLDLDHGQQQLGLHYPKLKKLLEGLDHGTEELQRSRRLWIGRLAGPTLFSEVLEWMRRNMASSVPDPGHAHESHYEIYGDWMAAVLEFAPDEYWKVMRRWREVHHRRRNLWKALSKRGLPC